MKKLVVITTILLCCFYLSIAQEDTIKKSRIFKTWISLNNKPGEMKGVLYEIKDSSILVSSSFLKADYSAGKFEVSEINYNDIDLVKIRIKNSVLNRALIGAVTGFAIGGLIGLISGDDDPNTYIPHGYLDGPKTAGYKAIMYGI
jgi:hypothetical protein